jgi:hypothetical protein
MVAILLGVVLASVASAKAKWTGGPVTVCVTAADKGADGSDVPNAKDLQDSAKDLARRFKKDATKFTLVDPGEACKLAVRVTHRSSRPHQVVVKVRVGAHEKFFSQILWEYAWIFNWDVIAQGIEHQIKDWIAENRSLVDAQQ